jgi:hypothetical protein
VAVFSPSEEGVAAEAVAAEAVAAAAEAVVEVGGEVLIEAAWAA